MHRLLNSSSSMCSSSGMCIRAALWQHLHCRISSVATSHAAMHRQKPTLGSHVMFSKEHSPAAKNGMPCSSTYTAARLHGSMISACLSIVSPVR